VTGRRPGASPNDIAATRHAPSWCPAGDRRGPGVSVRGVWRGEAAGLDEDDHAAGVRQGHRPTQEDAERPGDDAIRDHARESRLVDAVAPGHPERDPDSRAAAETRPGPWSRGVRRNLSPDQARQHLEKEAVPDDGAGPRQVAPRRRRCARKDRRPQRRPDQGLDRLGDVHRRRVASRAADLATGFAGDSGGGRQPVSSTGVVLTR